MTIGIDLSSLQGAHRMRGIGHTLINFINNISADDRKKYAFVFYAYPIDTDGDPLALLNLAGFNYTTRELKHRRRITKQLPGRLQLLVSTLNQLIQLKDLYFGDSRIKNLKGIDFFLQPDQSEHLPRRKWGLKRGLIIYDLIPYVLEWEYLWSYRTARRRGFSRKAALRVKTRRWLYAHKIKANVRHADILLAISEHTKKDFVTHIKVRARKIAVTPLGINVPFVTSEKKPALKHFIQTSWGYVQRDLKLDPQIPFVLYVGGADKRRRLQDLVAAFNTLRAQGDSLKLILAGDTMQSYANIANEEIQYALRTSSYKDDIIYMGFVDNQTRDWLYTNARAFVFPSKYEGFGLPVLEAMSYGTTVICYKIAAIKEVANDCPVYVNNLLELTSAIKDHLNKPASDSKRSANIDQAMKWQWTDTSKRILLTINQLV